jgi:hypothetical protein
MEAICFPGYGTKIPNHNTQITNNIKITNSNDQNITITYRLLSDNMLSETEGFSVQVSGFSDSPS